MKIIGTGLNGLLGSKLVEIGQKQGFEFTNLDVRNPQNPVDITDLNQVLTAFEQITDAQVVVHLAAFTDVTAAWQQQGDTDGLAYKVNVLGTKNIATACDQYGKYLLHISTGFVFDGQKSEPYTESDTPNPIEWYGHTKYEAEQQARSICNQSTVLRIDFPFRSDSFPKPDIVSKTIEMIKKGYPLFANHTFGPTFIDDFSKILLWLASSPQLGLFHATANEAWSDYQFGQLLNQQLLGNKFKIKKGDLDQYLQTLKRPYQPNTALDSSKLLNLLPFKINTVEQAIQQVQVTTNS